MPIMIFTMLIVLVLAAAIIAVVVMGMEGTGRKQHPEIAEAMARTARHLNGEGDPPKALVQLFDEIDEVPDLNMRDIPEKLRTLRSAASARSAWSARSAPEVADVDLDAAHEMADALEAPVVGDPVAEDPYGVLGVGEVDPDYDTVPRSAAVDGDTVVRVRLPEGEQQS